jgi:hypothetical protein
LCFFNEFVDHGGCQGATAQALTRWWHLLASIEALDVLHWAMHATSYRHICMAIKITSDSPAFFIVVDLLLPIAIAK